ncbi:MAG: redox-sensing transcriptional repressor Rex [Ruminococcus sp.]|nr:redox-sensing transcriptional repressor Rex [Ruminococcus sp.]MBR6669710.1 redox-sensing transcriptional repressor Rex [Ruminococcus sp.]
MPKENISASVIKRLPRYYRFLAELKKQNVLHISSRQLAENMGLTASQIRHDLNCFGGFGQQGYGYVVSDLYCEIGKIIGVNQCNPTILIGAGNLGKAIASHINFDNKGFKLIGIFDSDMNLKGKKIGEFEIMHTDVLKDFCKSEKPVAAVLCIPKAAAADMADTLIEYGIQAFWNFSHYDLKINHSDVIVENVHLGDSIMTLSYGLNNIRK